MTRENILSFIVTFLLSLLIVPWIGKVTKRMGIIAHTNSRTIHKGIIPRTGGYGIYIAFLIGAMLFLKTDNQINSMMIGGLIIFLVGLYDDIHDLSPKLKMLGQIAAALVVIIYGGISLKDFTLPFIPSYISHIIAIIITIGWIIGITNAINLIDGLDGLCAGISIIVLFTISITSLATGRLDIASLSMLLIGSIAGFLVYNFHPAKIFMGDCGALFIGFMMAVISLLGFGYKGSTFFTLGAPIVVLAVPIMDTLIAIVRRKIHHKRFDEADKGHLHHKLMFSLELGQTKSVLILYGATALFSLCSYLYLNHKVAAFLLFILLLIVFELFVEITDMISRKYKPILTLVNLVLKRDDLPKLKESGVYSTVVRKLKGKKRYIILPLATALIISLIFIHNNRKYRDIKVQYQEASNPTSLMKTIYSNIEKVVKSRQKKEEREYVAAYFAADYYSLSNKNKDEIGGTSYYYSKNINNFKSYAKTDYYKTSNELIEKKENNIEVIKYKLNHIETSNKRLSGLEDYNYYDVNLTLTFNQDNPILLSRSIEVTITLIDKNKHYSITAYEINANLS
ncbi:hypothetical protein HMPREF9943_00049 [Eggerthia catenaformis OT 569 = DSM 20559]|uniref:Uncharacterized protein n=1 Tax=Eggerthia catenaformis OT 569 = DSM 20559 TaxID=999415 RepID=M2PB66_9FIRM|nr:MraY family glycosyltransferase [Eggerthia catenaformis]EMD17617.1 hypothetical protein HMPREF9943_00049 [Eggerthia catenaformis OT 569 = DSM 20559]